MPWEVGVACMANWLVSMLTWWLESGMAYSPRQVANWSLFIIMRGLHYAAGFDFSTPQ